MQHFSFKPLTTTLLLGWLLIASLVGMPDRKQALAEEGWQARFNELCAKTADAMSLSNEELKGLIIACDELQPMIDGCAETERKVYTKRLQQCRNLYVFVLDSKERGKNAQ